MNNNHRPTYCRDCKGIKTFERYPEKDIKTESEQVYMLGWRCYVCGHISLTSNPDYQPVVLESV